jgi:F-box and WD-40 domain protein CDC4
VSMRFYFYSSLLFFGYSLRFSPAFLSFFFFFLCKRKLIPIAYRQCIALLQGHAALVCQLQLSPTLLVTGGSDGRVITFSLSTFQPLHRIAAHDSSVTALQFDSSSSFSSFPSSGGDGDGEGPSESGGGGDSSSAGGRQGEGQFLVTAGNDGRVKLWELATGRWVRDLSDVSTSVWKVGCVWEQGCVAVMCRREGKTVVEIWSMRPRGKRVAEGGKVEGKGKEVDVGRVR